MKTTPYIVLSQREAEESLAPKLPGAELAGAEMAAPPCRNVQTPTAPKTNHFIRKQTTDGLSELRLVGLFNRPEQVRHSYPQVKPAVHMRGVAICSYAVIQSPGNGKIRKLRYIILTASKT
uniref:Uncharacterized protein n=1 Tax=Romanomermis culicivorax TaxID=13658 RepID=A0A915ID93_ROMCU